MRKTVYAAGALSMLAALAFAAPAQAGGKHDDGGHHSDDALLSVLHGVPGLTVDVWVDGKLTLDDFEPGTLAGPLKLDDGTLQDRHHGRGRHQRRQPGDRPGQGPSQGGPELHRRGAPGCLRGAHRNPVQERHLGQPQGRGQADRPARGRGARRRRPCRRHRGHRGPGEPRAGGADAEGRHGLRLGCGRRHHRTPDRPGGCSGRPRARTRLCTPGAAWKTTPWALPSRWSTRPSGAATTTEPAGPGLRDGPDSSAPATQACAAGQAYTDPAL